ncbi:hypothetical protein MKW94_009131 [Papaver nudicaule]|uniref:Uncharacterized protein n=1 Tax=Papaver nudicaule TaxID=74823 RepID=A0AA41VJ31_PAPNU|nr:hypothetical protein [Papaver nudicaule]
MEKLPGKKDKMPLLEPQSGPPIIPPSHLDVSDRSKFVSSIEISAKQFYYLLELNEDQKLSGQYDIVDVSLSNKEIRISSLVNFSSPQINVLVPANKPLSFAVNRKTLRWLLIMMAMGKEVHPIYLAYQPEENKLILADVKGQIYIETLPCTKKEISESLLHLKLDNSSGCL